jgi:uncharacterized protein YlxW (UPF0749 family)
VTTTGSDTPQATRPRPAGRAAGRLMIGLLCLLLGFGAALQVRATRTDAVLASARQDDLVGILDDVTALSDRLQREALELRVTRNELAGGTNRAETALKQAREREAALGILAGTVPARGPGIELLVSDPERRVDGGVLLDALQELRDAGAEAVQIGGVRVVASTAFVDREGRVLVDGQPVGPPYVLRAIGDPATMSAALDIPGGVLEVLRGLGADGTVSERDTVQVDALHRLKRPQYARPAPGEGSTG